MKTHQTKNEVRTPGENRTGMAHAPDSKRMAEVTRLTDPTDEDPRALDSMRRSYGEEAPELGTRPSVDGATDLSEPMASLLLDRIGERLAFERMGTRLYEGLLLKLEASGGFDGGPQREELKRFRDQEEQHFHLLEDAIRRLGGDPTEVTPSADLAAIESSGVAMAVQDPRVKLPDALHAILVAELADREGWQLLIRLGREAERDELVSAFEKARSEEERHLESVRGWVESHALHQAGVDGK